jgi:NAD(P)-dependent dehydrogenase (short-subunit alcohol dehydrogenase family)
MSGAAAGRVIVLTGATRGIGRGLAAEFARLGHTVLGCGRSPGGIADLAAGLPAPHDFAVVDVADHGAVSAWAGRLLDGWGAPDLVLNNAAVMNRPGPLWEIPAADFGRLMDVNVDGSVNVIRAFLPAMIARGAGVVVNMSSGLGRSTLPDVAPYCASKHAVEGLTGALAAELPAGLAAVAVSCACPGPTRRPAAPAPTSGRPRRRRPCWPSGRRTTGGRCGSAGVELILMLSFQELW